MDDWSHDTGRLNTFLQPEWTAEQIDFLRSDDGAAFCLRMQENFRRVLYMQDIIRDAVQASMFDTKNFTPIDRLPEDGPWNNMVFELFKRIGIDVMHEELSDTPLYADGNEPNLEALRSLDRIISDRAILLSRLLMVSEHVLSDERQTHAKQVKDLEKELF